MLERVRSDGVHAILVTPGRANQENFPLQKAMSQVDFVWIPATITGHLLLNAAADPTVEPASNRILPQRTTT
jgi:hypothetical protein